MGASLGENRLEVILDRVLGQRHLARHPSGVAARGKQAEQFVFAGTQAESAAEELDSLGSGRLFDSDDDRCGSAGGRLVWRKPGGTQSKPEAISQMCAGQRWMCVNALLNGQELGGNVVDARRDGPFVSLGRKQCIQPSARSCRAGRDPQVVVECQDDRSEVRAALNEPRVLLRHRSRNPQ